MRQNVLRSSAARYVSHDVTVVVASMDWLARNLDDLRRLVQVLTVRSVKVEFLKEHLTLTREDSPMAQLLLLLLSVMGAFAEFERALIHERQREGIVLAKARGAYQGVLSPHLPPMYEGADIWC
jgi:DNA invertase Pin-like site-specific DNA recombinase